MVNCEYCKVEVINGIEHQKCTNEKMKEINKSNEKDIPCMGSRCNLKKETGKREAKK